MPASDGTAEPTSIKNRPDLSRRALLLMLAIGAAAGAMAFASGIFAPPDWRAPGIPPRQGAAILGTLLLLVPYAFSVTKRSGWAASPPTWFVAHAVSSTLGMVFIAVHASGGNFLTLPGLVLFLFLLLVVQGILARAILSEQLSTRFAAQPGSYLKAEPLRREQLKEIIKEKRELLMKIDGSASEALFSPNLRHWMRHPRRTLAYQRLALAEARLVGSRRAAGVVLAQWRRVHIGVAYLALVGMLLHVVLVLFFAGYVAAGRSIYWWHIAAWGG